MNIIPNALPSNNGRSRNKRDIESSPDRPEVWRVLEENVPDAMRRFEQWICWRYQRRNEKWTKLPVDAKTGRAASSTDPATWATFDQALDYSRRHDLAGVGFVFVPDGGYAGVDLDDCRD